MNAAIFALSANVVVAILFAACFAAIALSYERQQAVWWFCAAYLVGTMTPGSELLVHFSDAPAPFVITSYASFLACPLIIAAGLGVIHGKTPPWRTIAAIYVGGLALRGLIWGGPRGTLPYEFAYQLPFSAATLLGCIVVLRVGRMQTLYVTLATSLAIDSLHFLVKPFLAVALGSGPTAKDYSASAYALYSQASTGILLVATGLLLLLLVIQKAVAQSLIDAETDPLANIANRRGFERHARLALARAERCGGTICAVMFDLDHFKAINDAHGHAIGDEVIAAFAALLRRSAPQSATIGRLGGEEFAMILERTAVEGASLIAQAIRIAVAGLADGGLPLVSVSGGVAERRRSESLSDLMRRADQACYQAKKGGRDCICMAEGVADPNPAATRTLRLA